MRKRYRPSVQDLLPGSEIRNFGLICTMYTQHYNIQESLANAKVSTLQPCSSKTDFDMKKALKVIVGRSFCNEFQADKGVAYCRVVLIV